MQDVIEGLVRNAKLYKQADSSLAAVFPPHTDPIASTVLARKNTPGLSPEAYTAASYLNEILRLHEVLVKDYGMDNDAVRAIWFPILNTP